MMGQQPGTGLNDQVVSRQLIAMHWLMAALTIAAVAAILVRGNLPSGHEWRPVMRNVHLFCGQAILMLLVVRVVVRWRNPLPPTPGAPEWAARAGHAAHWALYGVMLLQPVTGIVFMQAGDKTVSFMGWALPQWVPSDKDLHTQAKDWHMLLGTGFYFLLGLHVTAALWHHFHLKNQTLRRMLGLRPPAISPAPGAPD